MEALTVEDLEKMPPGEFARGSATNGPDDIFMTDGNIGRKLKWVAIRGGIPGWKIYIHWGSSTDAYVRTNGDKLTNPKYIRKLMPCTDEAFARYEF